MLLILKHGPTTVSVLDRVEDRTRRKIMTWLSGAIETEDRTSPPTQRDLDGKPPYRTKARNLSAPGTDPGVL